MEILQTRRVLISFSTIPKKLSVFSLSKVGEEKQSNFLILDRTKNKPTCRVKFVQIPYSHDSNSWMACFKYQHWLPLIDITLGKIKGGNNNSYCDHFVVYLCTLQYMILLTLNLIQCQCNKLKHSKASQCQCHFFNVSPIINFLLALCGLSYPNLSGNIISFPWKFNLNF